MTPAPASFHSSKGWASVKAFFGRTLGLRKIGTPCSAMSAMIFRCFRLAASGSGLGQAQRHSQQLPVTRRKQGVNRQVERETQPQGRLVDVVERFVEGFGPPPLPAAEPLPMPWPSVPRSPCGLLRPPVNRRAEPGLDPQRKAQWKKQRIEVETIHGGLGRLLAVCREADVANFALLLGLEEPSIAPPGPKHSSTSSTSVRACN